MPALQIPPGVEGILGLTELPDPTWLDRWQRIVIEPGLKERLLNFMVFSLRYRGALTRVGLPVHGLIVLAGAPGTGKTTLAGGLADQAARLLGGEPLLFVDVDPHAFPSQLLGESQRSVARLFTRTLPDLARRGAPVVVLLDEVEALAVDRAGASLETNPVDVHRATDAVLSGIDHVAGTCSNVTFIATTNRRAGVDEAFMSRADLVEAFALPGVGACTEILVDALGELRRATGSRGTPADPTADPLHDPLADPPAVQRTISDADRDALLRVADACVADELDGRQVRKLVLRAVCSSRELALAPERLSPDDLLAALRSTRAGVAPAVTIGRG